jgi:hypothetical protein
LGGSTLYPRRQQMNFRIVRPLFQADPQLRFRFRKMAMIKGILGGIVLGLDPPVTRIRKSFDSGKSEQKEKDQ